MKAMQAVSVCVSPYQLRNGRKDPVCSIVAVGALISEFHHLLPAFFLLPLSFNQLVLRVEVE
jgi:hypothetical protein